jgi:hypothetical protein
VATAFPSPPIGDVSDIACQLGRRATSSMGSVFRCVQALDLYLSTVFTVAHSFPRS